MSDRPQDQADTWNANYPVGTPVVVERDNGELMDTATRSEAWVVGGHTAVVSVKGIAGGYRLNRVSPKSQRPTPGVPPHAE